MKKMFSGTAVSLSVLVCTALLCFTNCKKESHEPPAKGYLLSSEGGCYASAEQGTYYTGIPSDSNYVPVQVQVTSPGSYNITTDKQNGVTFSASGVFSDTGKTTVNLRAKGTFIKPGLTIFHLSFDTTKCQFWVTPQDSTGLSMALNTWKFTYAGKVYQGTGSAVWYEIPALGDEYAFYGSLAGYTDTSLTIRFAVFYGADSSGGYPTNLTTSNSFEFHSSRFDNSNHIQLHTDIDAQPALITIRRINNTVYTFNGTARDASNNIVPITDAWFRAAHRFVNEE